MRDKLWNFSLLNSQHFQQEISQETSEFVLKFHVFFKTVNK